MLDSTAGVQIDHGAAFAEGPRLWPGTARRQPAASPPPAQRSTAWKFKRRANSKRLHNALQFCPTEWIDKLRGAIFSAMLLAEAHEVASRVLASTGNAHSVLLLPPTASPQEIKASYKRLALLLHPDKADNDPLAAEAFRLVKDSFEALTVTAAAGLPGEVSGVARNRWGAFTGSTAAAGSAEPPQRDHARSSA